MKVITFSVIYFFLILQNWNWFCEFLNPVLQVNIFFCCVFVCVAFVLFFGFVVSVLLFKQIIVRYISGQFQVRQIIQHNNILRQIWVVVEQGRFYIQMESWKKENVKLQICKLQKKKKKTTKVRQEMAMDSEAEENQKQNIKGIC
eukprot:TRINITY_DN9367_c0_g1_i4.p3 TRINITY_DN9367_c0_g1~~TRINITY_DN9367_c0_g1_i4.p3  ORF type:complete len:145 (-),score=7.86 TRINITY_DN9367_c0_g1_i4:211-645(-)